MWCINGKSANCKLTVGDLIEELKKYPQETTLGYFAINAHLRGDDVWSNEILGVEWCKNKRVVAIIGGYQ